MNFIRNSLFVFVLLAALTGIGSASSIGYVVLDSRFDGSGGESRTINGITYSVGVWRETPASTPVAAFARLQTVNNITTISYSNFTIPNFNNATVTVSSAAGISANGTVVVDVGYLGQGARPVTFNITSPAAGTVISSQSGAAGSFIANGITGSGLIFGSNYQFIAPGANTDSTLSTGGLGGGEVFDGRTTATGTRLVGNGADLDSFNLFSNFNGSLGGWL